MPVFRIDEVGPREMPAVLDAAENEDGYFQQHLHVH